MCTLEPTKSTGTASFYNYKNENGVVLCTIQYWLLDCCGIGGIQEFHYIGTKEDAKELIKILRTTPIESAAHGSKFIPNEFLFSLGKGNPSEFTSVLIKKSKLLNSFENKAHESSGINLYQMSL